MSWQTPGEDPYLNGEYAKEFVAGFQGDGVYMKASVTIKHYVAYNLERDLEGVVPEAWCGSPLNQGGNCSLPNDRHSFNAHVTELDLRETYAAAFEAGTAGPVAPGAIMCSYNGQSRTHMVQLCAIRMVGLAHTSVASSPLTTSLMFVLGCHESIYTYIYV